MLQELQQAHVPMHIMSNYPAWWRHIEDSLHLSEYIPWTFLSCDGPMKGVRKPEVEGFHLVEAHLQELMQNDGSNILLTLVDDRVTNVEGAQAAGWDAIHFKDAQQLRGELQSRGIL